MRNEHWIKIGCRRFSVECARLSLFGLGQRVVICLVGRTTLMPELLWLCSRWFSVSRSSARGGTNATTYFSAVTKCFDGCFMRIHNNLLLLLLLRRCRGRLVLWVKWGIWFITTPQPFRRRRRRGASQWGRQAGRHQGRAMLRSMVVAIVVSYLLLVLKIQSHQSARPWCQSISEPSQMERRMDQKPFVACIRQSEGRSSSNEWTNLNSTLGSCLSENQPVTAEWTRVIEKTFMLWMKTIMMVVEDGKDQFHLANHSLKGRRSKLIIHTHTHAHITSSLRTYIHAHGLLYDVQYFAWTNQPTITMKCFRKIGQEKCGKWDLGLSTVRRFRKGCQFLTGLVTDSNVGQNGKTKEM